MSYAMTRPGPGRAVSKDSTSLMSCSSGICIVRIVESARKLCWLERITPVTRHITLGLKANIQRTRTLISK